ncbi:MAG: hypothetical protein JXB62_08860, partial [Pirellulales bacterium]|nr:hypothetical protein [Pirellulales bacterium]
MLAVKQVACLLGFPIMLLSLAGLAIAQSGDAPTAGWVNVTGNVGGETWGAYGVTYMRAVPGSNEVIAGVSERGLWVTGDGGNTWQKLGGNEMKCRHVLESLAVVYKNDASARAQQLSPQAR